MIDWLKTGDLVLKGLGVVGTVLSLVFGAAWWSLRQAMVTQEQFTGYRSGHDALHDVLDDRLHAGDARFVALETTLRAMPTKDDIADLRIRMEQLSGDIRVATAVIKRVEHPVALMVEDALEERAKS